MLFILELVLWPRSMVGHSVPAPHEQFKKHEANLNRSLHSGRLPRVQSRAQRRASPRSPCAGAPGTELGAQATGSCAMQVGLGPRGTVFRIPVSLSVVFRRFLALTPGSWQQPVRAGFEVGTITSALLLAAVIYDSLLAIHFSF